MKTRKECYEYLRTNTRLQKKIYKETGLYYPNHTTVILNDYIDRDYNSLINRIKRFFRK